MADEALPQQENGVQQEEEQPVASLSKHLSVMEINELMHKEGE